MERSDIHVVLIEPADSLNIGAVARAMTNLGFENLHLINPPAYDAQRAGITACWWAPLLEKAGIHSRLEEALGQMQEVVGFSVRAGKNRCGFLTLADWAGALLCKPRARTALLFGPEDNGLRQEHVEHCRYLIRIPTCENYPTMNLAQSVVVALYELSRLDTELKLDERPAPDWNQFYQLDRLLDSVGELSGFYGKGAAPQVPGVMKNLIRRMAPDEREARLMLGLLGRLDGILKRKIPF